MLFKKKQNQKSVPEEECVQKFGGELDFSTAEAFNLLRTNLSFAFPGKTNGKLVGITSAAPSEGKSYNAVNLAYSLAKDGQKVLLIDADLRKPTVAEKLGLKLAPGLSNRLITENDSFINEGVLHENLSVLTAGDVPPNPSELIGSEKMENLLKSYAETYDYVIVDLPPVMEVPDPLILSNKLDGIVITVMHERSFCSEVKETVRKLQFANARILGFIYNGYSDVAKRKRRKYARRHSKKIKK